MANKNIGRVACAHCGQTAGVRRYQKGTRALYYYCADCGIIRPNLPAGQAWIQKNATFYEDEVPASESKADEGDEAETQPEKPKKRRGILQGFDL